MFCDDVDRFGRSLCVHRSWTFDDELRQFGQFVRIYWVFIISKVRFGPFGSPPPIVRDSIGQSGLFILEHFAELLPEHVDSRDTTFTCYILLDDAEEQYIYDQLKGVNFETSPFEGPILVFRFPSRPFRLPQGRTIPEGDDLDPYQNFIPADEIILKVY